MRTVQYRSLQTAAMRTGSGMGLFLSLTVRDAAAPRADTYPPRATENPPAAPGLAAYRTHCPVRHPTHARCVF